MKTLGINPTELLALDWLRNRGIQIVKYQFRATPDFITEDGQGYEVKRTPGWKQVVFYPSQIPALIRKPSTTILVFHKQALEPFMEFRFEELDQLPCRYQGFYMAVWTHWFDEIVWQRLSSQKPT